MAQTKPKAGQFFGIVGHGTDGYFLMTNGDGTMSWSQASTGPSITSVDYPGDDTAADPAGGQTVVLTGTGFATSGMSVTIGGTTAPSVSHDSNTQLTITTPAKAAGDYDIVVTNGTTGASGTFVNGISYNGIPTWTTAAGSLGTFESETTISTITLQATEPDGGTITFNITSGALPSGLSLTGANIDGTTTAESSTTLYSFTIEAIDDENQATPRNFSITVNSAFVNTENFNTVLYTGNNTTQSITGVGFAPDFVWAKSRNGANNHNLYDTIRGANNRIFSHLTLGEDSLGALSSFDSDGFSLSGNGDVNQNFTYVAWCWKAGGASVSNTDGSITSTVSANQDAGFSIVQATTSGSGTIGHGLSEAPQLIITKLYEGISGWNTYSEPTGAGNFLHLDSTAAAASGPNRWNNTSPTTSVFSLGTDFGSGNKIIAYCFHSVDGYSKVGSYTGTAASGNSVTTGFEPRFVMIKRSDSTSNWAVFDNERNTTNPRNNVLFPNDSGAEYDLSAYEPDVISFNSNGFTINDDASDFTGGTNFNISGGTYIYLAIA